MLRIAAGMTGLLALLFGGNVFAQSYFAVTQHLFQSSEGSQPQAVAAAPDGSLYGIAQNGGAGGQGTLFRYAPDGTVTDLHDFNGSDGSMQVSGCCSHGPLARLLVAPTGDVFGFTLTGGNGNCQYGYGCGVIFRYSPSGGFSVLWKFTGGADGSAPNELLYGSDGNLYGAASGAPDDDGAVFQLTTGGSLKPLHTFCSSPNCADGFGPEGLAEGPDHRLYGHYYGSGGPDYIYSITLAGVITPLVALLPAVGNNWGDIAGNFVAGSDGGIYFTFDRDPYGSGRVDRYDIATNTLRMVHQFDYTDGDPPYTLVSGTDGSLYGTVGTGGLGPGASFRIVPPSTFTYIYDFQGILDGGTPTGMTQTADGRLFGVAASGGITVGGSGCTGCGTLYQLAIVPAAAPIVTTFDPASGPVGTPVTVSGSQLTGTVSLDFGSIASGFSLLDDQSLTTSVPAGVAPLAQFAITNAAGTGYTAEPFQISDYRYSVLFGFCAGSPFPNCGDGAGPVDLIQSVDGNFYGTTSFNFPSSVLFKVTPSGAQSVVASGLNIPNPITESGAYFYGTSEYGGYYGLATGCNGAENPIGCGTIFRVSRKTGVLTTLYKFKGLGDSAFPQGNLAATSGGNFYGTTPTTLFHFHGVSLQTVHNFAMATDGSTPSTVIAGQDGNLYGANTAGGSANQGTLFEYSPATASFTVLHSFAPGEGSSPSALVRSADGTLYGVTTAGGTSASGTLFRIDAAGTFTTLHNFSATDPLGTSPARIVLGSDGALYGYTTRGAVLGGGAVFRVTTDGSSGNTMYAFFPSGNSGSHGYGPTALLQGRDGDWYGTTYYGGALSCQYGEGCGTVFHIH